MSCSIKVKKQVDELKSGVNELANDIEKLKVDMVKVLTILAETNPKYETLLQKLLQE